MSESPHAAHQQAVHHAINQVVELRARMAHAAEHAELCMGVVIQAVGDEGGHTTEAGRNAFEMIAAVKEKLNEAIVQAGQAGFELERYMGGF